MKKLILLLSFCTASECLLAQLNVSFEKDTIDFERSKTDGITRKYTATVSSINTGSNVNNTISFSVNSSPATTLAAADYSIQPATMTVDAGTDQIKIAVTVHDSERTDTTYLSIQMAYNNGSVQTKTLVLKIYNKKEDEKEETSPSIKNRIMYLNAYNFDFSTKLASNYVGHLNLFSPSSSKNKKWGYNTGILKINYAQKDTSSNSGAVLRENVFINLFDTLAAGTKYLRQINRYQTEKRNTVWSFYFQPTYELTKKEDDFHVYVHGHLELLASKWSIITSVSNIQQDTVSFNPPADTPLIRYNISSNNTYSVNSLSGYFGGGVTLDTKPWENGRFFFQPTFGITSNKPSTSSIDINSGMVRYSNGVRGPSNYEREKPRTWYGFYLIRTYYTHVIAKEKATAVVGVDIRGLLPFYAPQYAVYAGLNLSFDSIFGLLKND